MSCSLSSLIPSTRPSQQLNIHCHSLKSPTKLKTCAAGTLLEAVSLPVYRLRNIRDFTLAHKKTKLCGLSPQYRPSDRHLSTKVVPTFTDRRCHVAGVTDPYGCILDFLDWSCYFCFEVAPQLYSQGLVDPIPDPLLFRKSGSTGNRNPNPWICSQEL
jgi:hypothetical protein